METTLDLFAMAAGVTRHDTEEYKQYRANQPVDAVDAVDVDDAMNDDAEERNETSLCKMTERLMSNTSNRIDKTSLQEEIMTLEYFRQTYEVSCKPLILLDVTATWNSVVFSPSALLDEFGEEEFSLFGGQTFMLKEYFLYCEKRAATDLSPLYLFDDLSIIPASHKKAKLLQAYQPPFMFAPERDLFGLSDIDADKQLRRPPFRWLLIGPRNSGTRIHIDPYGTSAWNTLLQGKKHWVLLSPEVTDAMATEQDSIPKAVSEHLRTSDLCVQNWFEKILPQIRSNPLLQKYLIEFIQEPAETVYVPYGWLHVVRNLTFTVCITQNYANEVNREKVRFEMAKEVNRKRFGPWMEHLKECT